MKKSAVLLLGLAACSGPLLREGDDGRQVRVDLGRVFTVAREAQPPPIVDPKDETDRPAVEITGESVRLLAVKPHPDTGETWFEFRADRPGPSEIIFTRLEDGQRVSDYSILVWVWQPMPVFRARVGLVIGHSRCRRSR